MLACYGMNDARKQDIAWLHDAQSQVDVWIDQARQLNNGIGDMCLCDTSSTMKTYTELD